MNKKEGYDTFTKDDGTTYKICNNCKYLNPYNILSHDEKEFSFCELLSEDSMGHLPNLPYSTIELLYCENRTKSPTLKFIPTYKIIILFLYKN